MEDDLGEKIGLSVSIDDTTVNGSMLVSRSSRAFWLAQQVERPAATLALYALSRNLHVAQDLVAYRLRNGLGIAGVCDAGPRFFGLAGR